ncbi:hypothetical protein D1007_44898 [Hordeum vulgare]|nr:hypothetical protein D1007_44898 [Hordeum vulgare]
MRMSGADGFTVSAPIHAVALGSATTTVVTTEHLPKGYEACDFVNWWDDECHGRAQSVITKFAEDNVNLNKKLTDLECTISTMK